MQISPTDWLSYAHVIIVKQVSRIMSLILLLSLHNVKDTQNYTVVVVFHITPFQNGAGCGKYDTCLKSEGINVAYKKFFIVT